MTTAETGHAAPHAPAPPEAIPPAPAAESRARRLLRHPVTLTTALAAALHVLWFFTFANSGGDLAAQDAWAEFVGRNPGSAYNLAWYGGMHPVSYSVVSPYLMHVLGVRTTMMLVGTVSAALLTLLLIRSGAVPRPGSGPGALRRALLPAFAGVYGLLCNAVSGRVTFGLGMMFGLAAVAAFFCWPHRWRHRRWTKGAVAAVLAGLATAGSPVAGLFVGFVAAALFVSRRRPAAYALGLAPVAVVAVSTWLFPFSGTQPMSLGSAALPFVFGVLVCVLVPRHWVTVRLTSGVYALAVLLVWAVHSQIGSNVTRLPMLFAGVVLAAALPFTVRASRKWYALVASLVLFTGWIGVKSVDDVVNTTPIASWNRELAPSSATSTRPAPTRAASRSSPPAATARPPPSPRTSTSPAAGTARPTSTGTPSSTTAPSTPPPTAPGSTAGPSTTWCCPTATWTATAANANAPSSNAACPTST